MLLDLVIPDLSLTAGGPTRTITQLSSALAAFTGLEVRLISQAIEGSAILLPSGTAVKTHIDKTTSPLSFKLGLPALRVMERALSQKQPQILHLNGIWHPLLHWCVRYAKRHDIPYIIQPHGMLEPWALEWRAVKKRIALAVYQRSDLESATLLVATSEQEANNLRRLGFNNSIVVIPNGVDLVGLKLPSTTKAALPRASRYALFLGRIHQVKGLENLLRAWASLRPEGWVLQLAGPDEAGHLGYLVGIAEQLGISDEVQFLGELDDRAKWTIYRGADLFVLPSFSENFGVVVAEALSQGLPVITTTGTPWEDLRTYGCGWWVEPSEAGLRDALREAFNQPANGLIKMGERGRQYIQRFDWSVIASQMFDAYRWVLGQGERPSCLFKE